MASSCIKIIKRLRQIGLGFTYELEPKRIRWSKVNLTRFRRAFIKLMCGCLKKRLLSGDISWQEDGKKHLRKLKSLGLSYQQIANSFLLSEHTARLHIAIPKREKLEQSKVCEKCKSTTGLHAHHTNYETDEFMVLCDVCHHSEHNRLKGNWTSIALSAP